VIWGEERGRVTRERSWESDRGRGEGESDRGRGEKTTN